MKLIELWTSELKNGIFGSITPTIDPFDNTKLYISDGWGSSFPSMRLRQLSLVDGKEMKSVSIKNAVRCIYFHPDETNIFAVSDNKIFQLNKTDFSIVKKFDKGIQKYNDYIASNDKDTLLLMNFNADYLFVYNFKSEKGTKKKLKTCRGIFKESDNTYLIFCAREGSVQRYDLQANKLTEILKTEIFYNTFKSKTDKFYLHLGKRIEATSNTHEKIEPISQIDIYKKDDLTKKLEIRFDFQFDKFIVSENEETLYLIRANKVWIYSLKKQQIEEEILLNEKDRIVQLFDEHKLFITYKFDEQNKITCWKF
jgi:hypothetical protein